MKLINRKIVIFILGDKILSYITFISIFIFNTYISKKSSPCNGVFRNKNIQIVIFSFMPANSLKNYFKIIINKYNVHLNIHLQMANGFTNGQSFFSQLTFITKYIVTNTCSCMGIMIHSISFNNL